MTNMCIFFRKWRWWFCFASCFCFQHLESMLCEAVAHLGDEKNLVVWRTWGCNSFTYIQNFLYGTSGIYKWEPMHTWSKTGVMVQALLLTDQGLWFQELYGAYMSFSRSQHHSLPQLQKGSCFCSCGGHVYWERGSVLEAGFFSLGSAGQTGSLQHV